MRSPPESDRFVMKSASAWPRWRHFGAVDAKGLRRAKAGILNVDLCSEFAEVQGGLSEEAREARYTPSSSPGA